jgi:hypothetical protein
MITTLNMKDFDSKMNNFIEYSIGFLEGINSAKQPFFQEFGKGLIAGLSQYIDSHARMDPQALHHVYEWYQTGSPEARLFNLTSTATSSGIKVNSSFRQSKTMSKESKQIFYNKASVMESGMPVTISPKHNVLVFEVNGETVFTKKKVTVQNPGGTKVNKSYEKTFDSFFTNYFSQSFLSSSGLLNYLEDVSAYKNNLKQGSVSGKSLGIKTGYQWLINANIGVE